MTMQTGAVLVAKALRDKGPMTRIMMANELGVAPSTVSHIVVALLRSGHVREEAAMCPCCARRTKFVYFVAMPVPPKRGRVKVYKAQGPKIKIKRVPPPKPAVKIPKHDGTVFGMMTSQLGVKT